MRSPTLRGAGIGALIGAMFGLAIGIVLKGWYERLPGTVVLLSIAVLGVIGLIVGAWIGALLGTLRQLRHKQR